MYALKVDATNGAWKKARLGDYFRIKHGYAFKGEFFAGDGPYVLLTPGNFAAEGGLKLKGEREKYYTGDFPKEFLLQRGDFIMVLTDLTQNAPILGSAAFVPEADRYLHNQRLGKIVSIATDELEPRFLYYVLNSESVRAQIRASATGATVRHTAPERVYAVEFGLPKKHIQRVVASILSAYDDLIENNTRRIAILEEMARSLYREWFVNFRFPGHENVAMVESALGVVPEDWSVCTLRDVTALINRGVSPRYDDLSDASVLNQKCIRGGRLTVALSRRHITRVPPERVVRFGDALVNSTGVGTLGRVAQVYEDIENCTVDSHVTIVRPNGASQVDWFGLTMLGLEPLLSEMGVGSTGQTELGRERLARMEVLLPPTPVQEGFGEIAGPTRRLAVVLKLRNEKLRETRDLLLPRLISGELDVSDLDIDTRELSA